MRASVPSRDESSFSLRASTDSIDIWRVSLRSDSAGKHSLSADEIMRAARFHFERDRVRFVRCRAAVRTLLGRYLGISAWDVQFEYQLNGKPEVAAKQNTRGLRFNVSHSEDEALIAVTVGRRLGIDLEKIQNDVDILSVAQRFFSVREQRSLRALPHNLQLEAFFACWTRKEAFLKATGDGLSFPLETFSVNTHPKLSPRIVEICGDLQAGQNWVLLDVQCHGDYRATVAVENFSQDAKMLRVLVKQRNFEP